MAYPEDIFDPREIENMPNVVYDADKKTVFFAEDHNGVADEIVGIEETLGALDPEVVVPIGGYLNFYNNLIANIWQGSIDITPNPGFPFPLGHIMVEDIENLFPEGPANAFALGGEFTIIHLEVTNIYRFFITYKHTAPKTHMFTFSYYDVSLMAWVGAPMFPLGAFITGSPRFSYRLEFNDFGGAA